MVPPECTHVQLKDGRPVTTSRTVAEVFGRAHGDVLRAIETIECSEAFRERNFALYSYKPEKARRSYKAYEVTRDGFVFLCMGFTAKMGLYVFVVTWE